MSEYVISPTKVPAAPVKGGGLFPVRRIFCVGRNYADHVREMGGDPKDTPPTFFTKPADAVVLNGTVIAYPKATQNLHYEGELVVALKEGGSDVSLDKAPSLIFGCAAGCDLTRRDHQAAAKQAGLPWDTAKGFDHSAPIGEIVELGELNALNDAVLTTRINGDIRQQSPLSGMIWSVPEIIVALSRQFELKPGDLIFTGTPEGVGPLSSGDRIEITVTGLPSLEFSIGE